MPRPSHRESNYASSQRLSTLLRINFAQFSKLLFQALGANLTRARIHAERHLQACHGVHDQHARSCVPTFRRCTQVHRRVNDNRIKKFGPSRRTSSAKPTDIPGYESSFDSLHIRSDSKSPKRRNFVSTPTPNGAPMDDPGGGKCR